MRTADANIYAVMDVGLREIVPNSSTLENRQINVCWLETPPIRCGILVQNHSCINSKVTSETRNCFLIRNGHLLRELVLKFFVRKSEKIYYTYKNSLLKGASVEF